MAERSECYKYTDKMIEAPTRDESRILANNPSEEIDSLKLENAELKKMILELKQSVNELAKSSKKTGKTAESQQQ